MNGLVVSNDSLRESNRARKQVLLAELERIQAQKEAVEQQIAALSRGPPKASQAKTTSQLALTGGPKKRPAKGVPVDDLRPDKRPKVQPEWQKKEQSVWSTCQTILKGMTKGGLVHIFMQPVSLAQFPDYSVYVKKPMDLGTVSKKLNKPGHRDYTDPLQFRDDVRQVWKNCSLYNTPDSPVGKTGLQMSEKFESQWSKYMVEDKWKQAQLAKQQSAQEQRNGVNAEEFHQLGRQLHDVTERIEIRTNPGPPSADRDMTFDEKRKLSVFISSIDGDKLGQVLEIITQEEPDLPGGQDGEIELDMDALSRKALWALHELYVNSVPGKNGPPRKGGGGGRSGTPGAARGASQGPMANQPEVSSHRSPAVKREGSGATGGAGAQRPIADSSTSSDSSSDDEDDAQGRPQKQAGPGGPTLMSSNHLGAPTILPSGGAKARQDTKLTNAAAWDSLAAGNGNEEEDGQKGAEEEEDNEGGLWNNFQARDDVERAEKQRQVREKEEAIRRQKEEEAKEAAAAAAKALEEEDKQKAEEAARKAEELAAVQREMDEKKAKDRAMLEAQAQEHDLEGAKTVHKMLHTAKAPVDGGLALRENEDDLDFGDEDDEGDEGADVEDMDVANEEGEVEEI